LLTRSNLDKLAETLGGLPVYGCLPGSHAARAGLRFGDVLLSVDGTPTRTWVDYLKAREHSGDSIRVRLFRDGLELEVDIPLDRTLTTGAEGVARVLGLDSDEPPAPRDTRPPN
jgi:S1-C subfamily serine protease